MQYSSGEKAVLAIIVSGLILSVFIPLLTTNTITNVSAVEASGVGVYWDSSCSDGVSSIDWGNLTPGSSRSIVVYIRNEVEDPTYLILWTKNWEPSEASQPLNLGWDHSGQRMDPNATLEMTLTLSVSHQIEGISSFSFDIIITASDSLPGDINGDGTVNIQDLVIAAIAFGSQPEDPNWNPEADLNDDDLIDTIDLAIIEINFDMHAFS